MVWGRGFMVVTSWFCQDLSNMNCKKKTLKVDTIDENSGKSSKTLAKSLEYVRCHRPAYVLLENVAKKTTGDILTVRLQSLGYVAHPYFINSAAFGTPQSRTRLYVIAVDPLQVTLLAGPTQWTTWLQVCVTWFGGQSVGCLYLVQIRID